MGQLRMLEAKKQKKRERQEAHRERIVEAAESVFADHGYDAARMHDIALRADLSMGTVYAVFPGKWEIFRAVHETRVSEIIVTATTAALAHDGALAAIRAGTDAYVRFLTSHPSYLRMHLRDGYSWASPMHLALGAQAAGWEQGIALLGELFGRAMAEESLRKERPELVAKLVVASHQVFLADWVERGMKDDPADLVAAIWAHFEQSFAARKTSAREETA